jgi:hypothetical protein
VLGQVCRVSGLGFKVWVWDYDKGVGLRVCGLEFGVRSTGFRDESLGFMV